jgi:hypothetical protein
MITYRYLSKTKFEVEFQENLKLKDENKWKKLESIWVSITNSWSRSWGVRKIYIKKDDMNLVNILYPWPDHELGSLYRKKIMKPNSL